MKYVFILFLVLHVTLGNNTFGQCCSAGNPVGGDGSNDGLSKNELRIFASYKYSLSKDYFHHDSRIDLPYIEKSYFDYNNLSLTYGLSPRFSLHSELGYFIDKTQDLNINNKYEIINSHGLGDLSFSTRYIAFKTVKPVSQLVFSAGVRIPVGAFSEEIDGVTIPISLQPSSGALKYNAGAFYSRKRVEHKFGWNSFAIFELSQTIKKGYLIYQYGNYFQLAFAGTYAMSDKITVVANTKMEWRGKDTRESGIKIESTGSKVILINPQFIFNLKNRWGIITSADFPIYKYVNGSQLTNKFSVQIGIRKSFSFCKIVK